jgi:hypothetical protein
LTKLVMPDNQMLSNRRHVSFNSDGDIARPRYFALHFPELGMLLGRLT